MNSYGCVLVDSYLAIWIFGFLTWLYGAYFFFRSRRFFQPRSWWLRLSPFARFQPANFASDAAPWVIRSRNAMLVFVCVVAVDFAIIQVAIRAGVSCAS